MNSPTSAAATKFAFFDLDNTLVDQSGALREWAEHFVADRGLDPAAVDFLAVKSSIATTWTEYAADFKQHFQLSDSVEQLVRDVTETYPRYFVLDDAVHQRAAGLTRRRAAVLVAAALSTAPQRRADRGSGHGPSLILWRCRTGRH